MMHSRCILCIDGERVDRGVYHRSLVSSSGLSVRIDASVIVDDGRISSPDISKAWCIF
jgi:hypothetical protein